MIAYEEAIRELVGLSRLCELSGSADGSSRLRGAVEIVAAIYEIPRGDVLLDLRSELLLEGVTLSEE